MGAIVATISHITAAVVHVIKIPFKILYAFWLQIKPYMMIFGHHIQMSGSDLSNGFASLGKFGSLISSSK